MNITYTFPKDFKLEVLRGVTVTGGKFCRHDGKWQERDNAVRFETEVDGKKVVALCAGKPELEVLLAEHLAKQDADKLAKEAFDKTPEGIYQKLKDAEYNLYDPENFPGSVGWQKHKIALDALEKFESENAELVEKHRLARKAEDDKRYEALSDFVKNGS